ncbi:hypothetical protein PPL_08382 [Heterostelium album PN500]|uniref:Uncharacterized protein n=1 Tax=Heterostelium pallidum (strain ATCC 26659 / Pp 5 / PN500) TaxID=670386 RepID=D3BI14_HETP5|nr:hypothetical protein PPL_08382 [Heterostelium album PN500]EFA78914.1 hypothetical protein PPL_08382 [Heterostelium album PN500]|eukprot:XP_020431038.1 hypothetical protein PPL_08382 [Heterostelium album PN500]
MVYSISLVILFLLSMRIGSIVAQPTILSCTDINFTSISLINGTILQNYNIDIQDYIFDLLKCSGNDYYIMKTQSAAPHPGHYNISILNSETGTLTTKASFYLPENPLIVRQYNSIDLQNGLAFATYCPLNVSYLLIFDLNTETIETIISENICELYAYGGYDPVNQLYYLYGYRAQKLQALSFGVYSMITKSFTYYKIPYVLHFLSYVQSIYVYQSTVYVGVVQNTYYQLIKVDFNTKKAHNVFKENFVDDEGFVGFVLDDNGYFVIVAPYANNYTIYTIDLQTEQFTNHTIPNLVTKFPENFLENMFCAQ